eukprot:TRINITY_DN4669_c0_g1_i4.p1 TRINITY_DN4669_c0_g1~~TRINITY_DN4669_c0_g1_i4.p1  ORF type:complete len:578 (+),score=150.04 TRINITY_DN4669_c0_g1_i4:107-1840(+)
MMNSTAQIATMITLEDIKQLFFSSADQNMDVLTEDIMKLIAAESWKAAIDLLVKASTLLKLALGAQSLSLAFCHATTAFAYLQAHRKQKTVSFVIPAQEQLQQAVKILENYEPLADEESTSNESSNRVQMTRAHELCLWVRILAADARCKLYLRDFESASESVSAALNYLKQLPPRYTADFGFGAIKVQNHEALVLGAHVKATKGILLAQQACFAEAQDSLLEALDDLEFIYSSKGLHGDSLLLSICVDEQIDSMETAAKIFLKTKLPASVYLSQSYELYRNALELLSQHKEYNDPEHVHNLHRSLASISFSQGYFLDAANHFQEAARAKKILDTQEKHIFVISEAVCFLASNESTKAIESLSAINITEDPDVSTATVQIIQKCLFCCYAQRGQTKEASKHIQNLYKTLRASLGLFHERTQRYERIINECKQGSYTHDAPLFMREICRDTVCKYHQLDPPKSFDPPFKRGAESQSFGARSMQSLDGSRRSHTTPQQQISESHDADDEDGDDFGQAESNTDGLDRNESDEIDSEEGNFGKDAENANEFEEDDFEEQAIPDGDDDDDDNDDDRASEQSD